VEPFPDERFGDYKVDVADPGDAGYKTRPTQPDPFPNERFGEYKAEASAKVQAKSRTQAFDPFPKDRIEDGGWVPVNERRNRPAANWQGQPEVFPPRDERPSGWKPVFVDDVAERRVEGGSRAIFQNPTEKQPEGDLGDIPDVPLRAEWEAIPGINEGVHWKPKL